MAIKKSTTKKAAQKAPAKKAPAKKAVKKVAPEKAAKKAPAKKVADKAPAKTAVKKVAKPSTGSAQEKKAAKTTIIANVDVGFGNSLYIRGEGAGLSWEKGTLLDNVSPYEWAFSTTKAKGEVTFKFLINDEAWADGDNLSVAAGGTSINSPVFTW